jgi:hypothetical protein
MKGKKIDLSDLYADKIVMLQRKYVQIPKIQKCFIYSLISYKH